MDIHHLLKYGYLQHARKGWIDGVPVPITKETAWDPQMPLLRKLRIFTDGAPGQYACRQAAHGTARFWVETGSDMEHLICECGCFKGCWDGYGKDCQHCIRRAVKNETHVVNTVQDWCKLNATELLIKPTKADAATENFAANSYWHLYYGDDDFIKETLDCHPLKEITSYKYFCGARTPKEVGVDQGWLINKQRNACFCGASPCTEHGAQSSACESHTGAPLDTSTDFQR